MGRSIFVTVGTTKFDDLVQSVDSLDFSDAARKQGYTKIVVQHGATTYKPHNLLELGKASGVMANGIEVEFFDYAPSLAMHMSSADLIISHAGSGSIFESLTMGKPLIVVPNPILMDNHQAELGEHLANMQHLVCATPQELPSALAKFDSKGLKPFQKGDAKGIVAEIDKIMKFA